MRWAAWRAKQGYCCDGITVGGKAPASCFHLCFERPCQLDDKEGGRPQKGLTRNRMEPRDPPLLSSRWYIYQQGGGMEKFLKAVSAIAFALPLLTAAPASFAKPDKPQGDHPERHCKPEKQICGTNQPDQDADGADQDNGYDPYDNPWGDHPERKCFPEREYCPAS